MLSSNNSSTSTTANYLPSSCFHLSPPPFVGHNGHDIFLHHHHHHHHDLLVGHLLPANISPVVAETVSNQAINVLLHGGELGPYESSNSLPKKKPVKKDRHSKIYTAQGPRDRRVRLSIGIARKFFDLQDTLGFDKASKTLDWLFTKSKTAIDELSSAGGCSKNISLSSTSDDQPQPQPQPQPQGMIVPAERNPLMTSFKQPPHTHRQYLLARESRAKARARARERTREKIMCTTTEMSDSNPPAYTSSVNQDQSIVVTRKFKPSSAFDDSNNNSHPQHWDITSLLRVRASML